MDKPEGQPIPPSSIPCYEEKYKSSNPKDQAGTTRPDLTLFPQAAIVYGCLAMTEGDRKYGGYNFRIAGVSVNTYVAACMRHLFRFYNGEWADPESQVPHLASALADIAVLIDSIEMGNVYDDRPPRADMGGLLSGAQDIVKHLHRTFPKPPVRFTEKEHGHLNRKDVEK